MRVAVIEHEKASCMLASWAQSDPLCGYTTPVPPHALLYPVSTAAHARKCDDLLQERVRIRLGKIAVKDAP